MKGLWRRLASWLDRLERVPGEWTSEIDALKESYPSQSDLQTVLDDRSVDDRVMRLAAEKHLDPRRVFLFLEASLAQTAAPLTSSWLSRHWVDLCLLAGITILVMLPMLGPESESDQKARSTALAATKPQAIAKHDLEPYVAIAPKDLETKNTKSENETQKLLADFIGRRPLKVIQAGDTIGTDQLIDKKIILTDSAIVRVTLKLGPALEGHILPAPAELLFSNRGTSPAGELFSVVLLNMDKDGLTATIAVPEARLSDVAKWIGNCDAYVSFSTH
jgi:hypothetical protein